MNCILDVKFCYSFLNMQRVIVIGSSLVFILRLRIFGFSEINEIIEEFKRIVT